MQALHLSHFERSRTILVILKITNFSLQLQYEIQIGVLKLTLLYQN